MAKQKKFTCPVCGSDRYGSDSNGVWAGKPTVVRHCHGDSGHRACHFTWPIDNDGNYFTDTEYDAPEGPFVATATTPGAVARKPYHPPAIVDRIANAYTQPPAAPGPGAITIDPKSLAACIDAWREEVGMSEMVVVEVFHVGGDPAPISMFCANTGGPSLTAARVALLVERMTQYAADFGKACEFLLKGTHARTGDVLGSQRCTVAPPPAPMSLQAHLTDLLAHFRDAVPKPETLKIEVYQAPVNEGPILFFVSGGNDDPVIALRIAAKLELLATQKGKACTFDVVGVQPRTGRKIGFARFDVPPRAAPTPEADAPAAPAPSPPPVAPAPPPADPELPLRCLSAGLFAQIQEWADMLTEGSGESGRMIVLDVDQPGSGAGPIASYRVKTDHTLGVAADRIAMRLESFTRALGRTEADFMIYAKDAQSGVALGRHPALCVLAPLPPAPVAPPAPTASTPPAPFPTAPDRSREELLEAIQKQLRAWAGALMMSSGERHRAIVLDLEQVHGGGAEPVARYVVHTDHDLGPAAAWIMGDLEKFTRARDLNQADFMLYAKDQQSNEALGWWPARFMIDAPAARPTAAAATPRHAVMIDVVEACAAVGHDAYRAFCAAQLAEHMDEWDLASEDKRERSRQMAREVLRGAAPKPMHDVVRCLSLDDARAPEAFRVPFDELMPSQRAGFVVFRAAVFSALKSLRALGVTA